MAHISNKPAPTEKMSPDTVNVLPVAGSDAEYFAGKPRQAFRMIKAFNWSGVIEG